MELPAFKLFKSNRYLKVKSSKSPLELINLLKSLTLKFNSFVTTDNRLPRFLSWDDCSVKNILCSLLKSISFLLTLSIKFCVSTIALTSCFFNSQKLSHSLSTSSVKEYRVEILIFVSLSCLVVSCVEFWLLSVGISATIGLLLSVLGKIVGCCSSKTSLFCSFSLSGVPLPISVVVSIGLLSLMSFVGKLLVSVFGSVSATSASSRFATSMLKRYLLRLTLFKYWSFKLLYSLNCFWNWFIFDL